MTPFDYCERLAKEHYENFPVGWFIPERLRKYVYALYAFARTADDFSDEKVEPSALRLNHLQEWEDRLKAAVQGRADHPIFEALQQTFRETPLPPQLLADLLVAFRWDVTKTRYQNYAELEEYCRYSANPIGRAVLLLFGYTDPQLLALSDQICTGIQLVNHWQDIAVDWQKGRVYLPDEDLKKFHYSCDDLEAHRVNDPFRELMRFELDRTRRLFTAGRPLLNALSRRLRWQIELMWGGPMRILEKIEAVDYDIFQHRPRLTKRDLAKLFLAKRLQRWR